MLPTSAWLTRPKVFSGFYLSPWDARGQPRHKPQLSGRVSVCLCLPLSPWGRSLNTSNPHLAPICLPLPAPAEGHHDGACIHSHRVLIKKNVFLKLNLVFGPIFDLNLILVKNGSIKVICIHSLTYTPCLTVLSTLQPSDGHLVPQVS